MRLNFIRNGVLCIALAVAGHCSGAEIERRANENPVEFLINLYDLHKKGEVKLGWESYLNASPEQTVLELQNLEEQDKELTYQGGVVYLENAYLNYQISSRDYEDNPYTHAFKITIYSYATLL